jgi:hypothetical protein
MCRLSDLPPSLVGVAALAIEDSGGIRWMDRTGQVEVVDAEMLAPPLRSPSERALAKPTAGKSLLGLFADEPEVVEEAMESVRERRKS